MSLAEIEAAAEGLSLKEKQHLLEFLAARVNGRKRADENTNLADFAGVIRLSQDPLEWQRKVRGEWE